MFCLVARGVTVEKGAGIQWHYECLMPRPGTKKRDCTSVGNGLFQLSVHVHAHRRDCGKCGTDQSCSSRQVSLKIESICCGVLCVTVEYATASVD